MRNLLLNLCYWMITLVTVTHAWAPPQMRRPATTRIRRTTTTFLGASTPLKEGSASTEEDASLEETTEKYGLEVGIFESMKKKDGGDSAKSLLQKYGIAYLATSIPLAALSFALCYTLVDNGVDVAALLAKVGIDNAGGAGAETAGTAALAYAFHKAASPIRFPPTVMLTPLVAKWIGKEPNAEQEDEDPAVP
jgi:hypothetical protein